MGVTCALAIVGSLDSSQGLIQATAPLHFRHCDATLGTSQMVQWTVEDCTVTLVAPVNAGDIDFISGIIHGPGPLFISGVLTWSSGEMRRPGQVSILATGALAPWALGPRRLTQGLVLMNQGDCTIFPNAPITLEGAAISNVTPGTFELRGDAQLLGCAGSTFINSGLFRTTLEGTAVVGPSPLNNSKVDFYAGTTKFTSYTAASGTTALQLGNAQTSGVQATVSVELGAGPACGQSALTVAQPPPTPGDLTPRDAERGVPLTSRVSTPALASTQGCCIVGRGTLPERHGR